MTADHPFTGLARRQQNAAYHNTLTGEARSDEEEWLTKLGVRFVAVLLVTYDGRRVYENHVADGATLRETVKMSPTKFRYAVIPCREQWEVIYSGGAHVRYFDSREAAEMWAIHHG